MTNASLLRFVAFIIVLVGGINWGLIGLGSINLIGIIFGGDMSLLARLIYIIIGVAAAYIIYEDYIKKTPSA